MARVEIEGIGIFDIKHNFLHRRPNPRIVTKEKGKYKVLQFNGYRSDILPHYYQQGWDNELNKIYLRIVE